MLSWSKHLKLDTIVSLFVFHTFTEVIKARLAFPTHDMKSYGGMEVYIHLFLILAVVGGQWSDSRPSCLNHGERLQVYIEGETGWAPEQTAPAGIWAPYCPAPSLVTVPQLCHNGSIFHYYSPSVVSDYDPIVWTVFFFGSWGFTVVIVLLIFVICSCFYMHYLHEINVQAWRSLFFVSLYEAPVIL
jgi:hypothetical protein